MSLSPWDLSGRISFNFDLNRPRRASYVFATRAGRGRNESYRHATKTDLLAEGTTDFIEGLQKNLRKNRTDSYKAATQTEEWIRKNRTDSYKSATKTEEWLKKNRADSYKAATRTEEFQLKLMGEQPSFKSPFMRESSWKNQHKRNLSNHFEALAGIPELKESKSSRSLDRILSSDEKDDFGFIKAERMRRHSSPCKSLRRQSSSTQAQSDSHSRKNLIILSVSFLLVFTAFRAIQNLQSSLNSHDKLGVIAMGTVHGTMFFTCLFTPVLINKLSSKWTIVLGLLFYLFWIAANFYPHFYTLIPTSIGVGFGQSLAWGAQVTYIQKLAVDYSCISREISQQELFKLNGIFLALFQSSHIWGNLVSSLMLTHLPSEDNVKAMDYPDMTEDMTYLLSNETIEEGIPSEGQDMSGGGDGGLPKCGMYDTCENNGQNFWNNTDSESSSGSSNMVLKMMGVYLGFAFAGFVLILLFLEKIGAKADIDKTCLQVVWTNVQMLVKHKMYRLLTPLLIFNGFEQGFIYSDYTKSYITCTVGVKYVGYNMITLGVVNSVFSVIVGMASKHVPREAIIGVGGVLQVGLMIFLLVWIPDTNLLPVFFIISALWGICDAVWQTQCNYLVNLSCTEPQEHDVAFQNFRMLQGFGAAMAFFLGSLFCVSVKLYILITLLVLAIFCYVIVEIQLKNEELSEAEISGQAHEMYAAANDQGFQSNGQNSKIDCEILNNKLSAEGCMLKFSKK